MFLYTQRAPFRPEDHGLENDFRLTSYTKVCVSLCVCVFWGGAELVRKKCVNVCASVRV